MRILANLFLNLFLADGLFSLLDEIANLIAPVATLSEVRSVLASTALLVALVLYPCMLVDRRLPKRLLLPLTLFVILCPLSPLLVPQLVELPLFGLLASAVQAAMILILSHRFRCQTERGLRLADRLFEPPLFRLRQTLVFFGVNLAILPPLLLLFAYNGTNLWLKENTSGFMRFSPEGLHMVERTYGRGDRTVRLAGMIHVGEKGYYDSLSDTASQGRTLVLAEGVSDDSGLLTSRLDYGRMAEYLGLIPQKGLLYRGRLIDEKQMEAPAPAGSNRNNGTTDILRADLDMSDFKPPTLQFLNALARELAKSDSFLSGLLAVNSWAEKNMNEEMLKIVTDDILHRRNLAVVGHLDTALKRYDTVIIPWGALHMKEIEAEVLKRGFSLKGERERVSIGFGRLLSAKK